MMTRKHRRLEPSEKLLQWTMLLRFMLRGAQAAAWVLLGGRIAAGGLIMTEKVKDQILAIRDTGLTNLFDIPMVQRLAYERG